MKPAVYSPALPVYGPAAYCSEIRKFNAWLKGREISPIMILEYFQQLKVSPASKSVAKYAIKRALKMGISGQNRMIDAVQLETIFKQIKTGQAKRRVSIQDLITETEMAMIRKEAPGKTAVICDFLYQSGLRISELAGIELRKCSGKDKVVQIEILGKGNKVRTILVSSDLFLKVRELFSGERFLFGKSNGDKYTTRHLRKLVCETESIIGRKSWPHLYRHSFSSRILQKTHKIKALSLYLGHSSTAITLSLYVHEEFSPDELIGEAV